MCVCVDFCVLCVSTCVCMFVDALKALMCEKITKSIPEPILECQIHFPAVCVQVLLQLGMLQQ